MKKILLSYTLAFSTLVVQAQIVASSEKDALLVTKTKLAVVLMDEDPKELQYLQKKKPDEVSAYKQSIETYNSYLKEIVPREWNISVEVMFVSEDEARQLKKSNDKSVCLLEPSEVRSYAMGNMPNVGPSIGPKIPKRLSPPVEVLQIALAAQSKFPIAKSYWSELPLSRGSMLVVIQNLRNQIEDAIKNNVTSFGNVKKEIAKRSNTLRNKTLLVIADNFGSSWDAETEKLAKKNYPLSLKFISLAEAETYLLNHDEGYAYTWVFPAGAHDQSGKFYNYFILDAKDGRILFITGKSRPMRGEIGMGHLKDAYDAMEK